MLSLLMLFTPTAMAAAKQNSEITEKQLSISILRGKSLKQTREFLNALLQVESQGNDKAVGDHGNAIGAYQIWRNYWRDAVEYDKTIGGKYEDCFTRKYAERVVVAYLNRYAPEDASWETLARIHNGGPKGYKIKATAEYWEKVKCELQKQK
jgi:hypothetical protein